MESKKKIIFFSQKFNYLLLNETSEEYEWHFFVLKIAFFYFFYVIFVERKSEKLLDVFQKNIMAKIKIYVMIFFGQNGTRNIIIVNNFHPM